MGVPEGAIGIAGLPALCGLSAQSFGLESVPPLLIVGWALLLLAYTALGRRRLSPVAE